MGKNKTTTTVVNDGKIRTTTTVVEEIINTDEKTQIVAVLDRSGSMGDKNFIHTAISKFNEYISGQKAQPGDATVSVILFDDEYEVLHDNINLNNLNELTIKEWFPRGMTRLYDAIGKTINTITDSHNKMNKNDVPAKVLVVILTDGQENDSREFSSSVITDLIKEKEKLNWNFIFLGANQDAFAAARKMGISYGNTLSFDKSDKGAAIYTSTLSNATSNYRSKMSSSMDFMEMSKTLMSDETPKTLTSTDVEDTKTINSVDDEQKD
jgi:uncharacterized protein YegL